MKLFYIVRLTLLFAIDRTIKIAYPLNRNNFWKFENRYFFTFTGFDHSTEFILSINDSPRIPNYKN